MVRRTVSATYDRGACGVRRLQYIDGLRAIAVLCVVATHVGLSTSDGGTWLSNQGGHGVELFFVISGFCLSYPTLERLRRTGTTAFDVALFAARRIVRIIPPYYAAIALFVAFGAALRHAGASLPFSMGETHASDIVKQVLFIDKGVGFVNASFWTLPIEFRWYFAFPIVLWLWTRSHRAFLCVAAASTAAYLTNAASPDLFVLAAFMLGIVAADAHVRGHWLSRYALPLLPIVALAAALTAQNRLSALWQAAAFLLVVAAGQNPMLTRMLSTKWLVAIGAASYSIYLVHEPLIAFMIARGVFPPLAGIAGVALGFAFWSLCERPFVQPALRDKLVGNFYQFLPRWLRTAGIHSTWVFTMPIVVPLTRRADTKRLHLMRDDDKHAIALELLSSHTNAYEPP
jgi:peptidoglycan/LPS O-acetylase OafA/YrhL